MAKAAAEDKDKYESKREDAKLSGITLPALRIKSDGSEEEIVVNVAGLRDWIHVMPGMTPPSEVPKIPEACMAIPGFKGCTGATKAVSAICQLNARYGYTLSNKSIADLKKAHQENLAAAQKEGKKDPLAFTILISDEKFALAAALGDGYTQKIGDQIYYKRLSLKLELGTVKEIVHHDPSISPDKFMQTLLEKDKAAGRGI